MQLCSAVTASSGNADDAAHLGGWFIWEVSMCVCVCVCEREREREREREEEECLSCMFFCKVMQSLVLIGFHSLHASVSGRGNPSCEHPFEVDMGAHIGKSLHSSQRIVIGVRPGCPRSGKRYTVNKSGLFQLKSLSSIAVLNIWVCFRLNSSKSSFKFSICFCETQFKVNQTFFFR